MNLRQKTTLTVVVALLALIVAFHLLISRATMGSFEQLERQEALKDTARAYDTLVGDLRSLDEKVTDWAAWDDAYRFVEDRNEDFVKSNLVPSVFKSMRIDLFALVTTEGEVVRAVRLDSAKEQFVPAPAELLTLLAPGHRLSAFTETQRSVVGVVRLGAEHALVAARPILTSEGAGPARGTILMGRLITKESTKALTDWVHQTVRLEPYMGQEKATSLNSICPTFAPAEGWWEAPGLIRLEESGPAVLQSSVGLMDVLGRRVLELRVLGPRRVQVRAQEASSMMLAAAGAIGVVLIALVLAVMGKLVLNPLARLSAEVRGITSGTNTARTISLQGRDELGVLADDIRQMLTKLDQARAEVDAAAQAKGLFLANTSHEIRTPLNGVVGALELLHRTELNERQSRYVRMARVASDTLLALINDVLDLSKIEAGAVELDLVDVDLRSLLGEVGELLGQRAEDKGITLRCELSPHVPAMVVGDPTRLRQVLLNLVANAVKFTELGGVVVRANADREENETTWIRFTVTDSGIGIPADRLDRLFRLFSQVDPTTTRRFGGSGLGLAICKQLVTLMGGEIGVASEHGRGSTFWFMVPMKRSAAASATPNGPKKKDLRSARFAVGCEDARERAKIERLMDEWGFPCQMVDNPRDLPRVLEEANRRGEPADVVILGSASGDLALELGPEIAFGDSDSPPSVLLIIDSAGALHIDLQALRGVGVSACLERPYQDQDLLDSIVESLVCNRREAEVVAQSRQVSRRFARDGRPFSIHVLLAEDNPVNQTIACELLSELGVAAVAADNGVIAVEQVLSGLYDLVLMDCQMPELDGFEATRRIRAAEAEGKSTARGGGRVPIVALTANAMSDDRKRCLESGMDDYLAKPLNVDALVAMIEKYAFPASTRMPVSRPAAPVAAAKPQTDPGPASDAKGEASAEVTAGSMPPDPTAQTIKLDELRHRCLDKPDLMLALLNKFQTSTREQLARLQEASAGGDLAMVRSIAHSVKGAAANMSAAGIAEAAQKLEAAAGAGDAEQATAARSTLTRELDRCWEELPGLLSSLTQSVVQDARR